MTFHSIIFLSADALKRDVPSLFQQRLWIFSVCPPESWCISSARLTLYKRMAPEAVPRATISLPEAENSSSPFDLRFFFFLLEL